MMLCEDGAASNFAEWLLFRQANKKRATRCSGLDLLIVLRAPSWSAMTALELSQRSIHESYDVPQCSATVNFPAMEREQNECRIPVSVSLIYFTQAHARIKIRRTEDEQSPSQSSIFV